MTLREVAEGMPGFYPAEVRDKNEKQRKVWAARWIRPAAKVVEQLGRDPALEDISRTDAVSLRDALQDRVLEGDMKGASAQKDLQNINLLWRKYHIHLGIDPAELPPSPFRGLGDGMARLDDKGRKDEVPAEALETLG